MNSFCTIVMVVLIAGFTAGGSSAAAPKAKSWRVRTVHITGNRTFKRLDLLSQMELRPVLLKKPQRFSKSRLKSDTETITRFYRNQGFLSVKVSGTVTGRDSLRKLVAIEISIDEGPRTVVSAVKYLPQVPDSAVAPSLRTLSDRPLILSDIDADEKLLREVRASRGFLFAKTSARLSIDTAGASAVAEFTTIDGPKVLVGRIRIEGAEHLKPRIVSRELDFKIGDTLTLSDVRSSERSLYHTGLFSSVYIDPVVDSSVQQNDSTSFIAPLPVSITLREADFFRLKLGVGYGTGEGFRGSMETSYNNLFRAGHRLTFKGNLSQKIQEVQTAYTTPWLWSIPLRFDATLYYNRFSDTTTFRGSFRGAVLSLERSFDNHITGQLWTKIEDVLWINTDNLPGEYPVKNTQSFGIDLTFDSRDDLLNPSTGAYSLLKGEAAGLTGSNSNQFIKLTGNSRIYWKIRKLSCASGIKYGWVRPYGGSTVVPIQDQFFAGGSRSVRGFKDNYLLTYFDFSDTSLHAQSGRAMVTANIIEIRFPLIWWINGAVFADAGILRDRFNTISLQSTVQEIRWTAGPGLRINTPLAVIRFDFGFKLNQKHGESLTQWHLDVGQSF